jgi:hypothetical protein
LTNRNKNHSCRLPSMSVGGPKGYPRSGTTNCLASKAVCLRECFVRHEPVCV